VSYLDGYDVSKHQVITPPLTGLEFAFARATYALTKDPKYDQHTGAFKRAGIVWGAYHFAVPWLTAEVQAARFLDVAKDAPLLVLDWEADANRGVMDKMEARRFIDIIRRAGRPVGLYASASGFPDFGQDFNWVAKWGNTQPSFLWHFWQWTSDGGLPGYPYRLDRNYFNGDLAALKRLAGQEVPRMAPALITSEKAVLVTVAAGTKAYDLDGKTELTTFRAALGERPSPFAAAGRRAIYATVGGVRRLVLVAPESVKSIPTTTQAVAAERARIRTVLGI